MSPMAPLARLRVLDLSRVLAGPWCGQLLADLGADVVKIERPGSGDDTRGWGPPYLRDVHGAPTGESAYYLSTNRGKRSVTIDLARPQGQALVRRLAGCADVLLENFKAGGLARYGLDYPSLRAVNPRLVYCSITGFGQDGPGAGRPGYDVLIQAMSGLMSITGEPAGAPQKVGVAVADVLTGLYAAVAVLAALAARERTGTGQQIDLALLDVQIAALANQAANYLVTGVSPLRLGNAHPSIVPYQPFDTADRPIVVACGNDAQFARLAAVIGRPELTADPRYATNAGRVEHREQVVGAVQEALRAQPAAHWLERLTASGIPCGPINTLGEAFEDAQVRHRGLRIALPHPLAGSVPLSANPIRFSATPVRYERPPPLLGEHTAEVLREWLEMGADELTALRAAGVV